MESISVANKRKGEALTRRLRELKQQGVKVTETTVARALNKSRSSVAHWKIGAHWPSPVEEERLAVVLACPPPFFADVGRGRAYAAALVVKDTHSEDAARRSLQQYRDLLAADATDPDTRERLVEIKMHLQNQIRLFYTLIRTRPSQGVPKNEP